MRLAVFDGDRTSMTMSGAPSSLPVLMAFSLRCKETKAYVGPTLHLPWSGRDLKRNFDQNLSTINNSSSQELTNTLL